MGGGSLRPVHDEPDSVNAGLGRFKGRQHGRREDRAQAISPITYYLSGAAES